MSRPFLELTPEDLLEALDKAGAPAYRASQLANWVYRKAITDPAKMTNVSATVSKQFRYLTARPAVKLTSQDGTIKLLLVLSDNQHIETVLIPTAKRITACLSTQVGCAMGCTFCASGADGLHRNLLAGEILEQMIHLQQASGQRITNVVIMGIGEPLANYAATVKAIRAIIDPKRFGISARNVTVSTIGLPRQIRRLAKENLPITLEISLHAPNDALRRHLIPAATKTTIGQIIAAAQQFYQSRRREVTIEYILLAGINDSKACADNLAQICKRLRCNVNLIRYNPIGGLPYEAPSKRVVQDFAEHLRSCGINVHVRFPRGVDIEAACGQLRLRVESVAAQDESQ